MMKSLKNFLIVILVLMTALSCNISEVKKGVPLKLALERKDIVSNVTYNLFFNIPKTKSQNITGEVDITFTLRQRSSIILDFRGSSDMIRVVTKKGKNVDFRYQNGHIIIPKRFVRAGENSFQISFISSNGSLNRSDEFLYTLLVPDRASTVFPCFDQPDIKAIFNLSLRIPTQWTALSNGMIDSIFTKDFEKNIKFKPTKPISTYLFAFAVGNFKVVSKTVQGRTFSLYHRETDNEKLNRNISTIFDLHAQSLNWLEEYTQIPYPFEKLDFILIPGFQYSGMEHPGAIFYRDSRLLLDENPSVNQKLRQANLIAHEVAHQWFGNLVTMRWFNDVWLKEVFAGFMADLIVNPQYPEVNHQLSFLLSHFPSAYSVDRTQGANPIVQNLDNMLFAGTLYGDIIYHKAPIMMQQLELIMGNEGFKTGVREYLKTYYMGNADWNELVTILDKYTETDLATWSKIWNEEIGRPAVRYHFEESINSIVFTPNNKVPFPPMWLDITELSENKSKRIWLDNLPKTLEVDVPNFKQFIANSSGIAYGYFEPDSLSLEHILSKSLLITNPVTRASVNLSLYELFLDGKLKTDSYIDYLIRSIEAESESQIRNYLLGLLQNAFWRFNTAAQRDAISHRVESTLWKLMQSSMSVDQKRAVFSALSSVFITNESFSRLYSAWGNGQLNGYVFSETERTNLAYELMIRKPELYHAIAFGEIERINNPDRVAQFDFTLGAVSPNPSQRVEFFEKLKIPANRKPEPWVTEALRWLHHPLRADFSIMFIEPSLDLQPELQKTGDIFFPKSWLDATLWGHSSPEAQEIVEKWIEANPSLSPSLRMKLLQSADMLFRVNSN